MQKISELLNTKLTLGKNLTIYHPVFKNRTIYYENSLGDWEKYEYDSNGNLIYSECSNGYWVKYKINSKGYIIYMENSINGIIRDNRITELTLDQIADKFNISVNQLKIKK